MRELTEAMWKQFDTKEAPSASLQGEHANHDTLQPS